MNGNLNRPALVLLTSHWLGKVGVALVTLAGFSWLFLLPFHLRGGVDNPYIGLLVFIAIPIAFFAGLALIPVGVAMARRRGAGVFADETQRRAAIRSAAVFFGVMTAVNLVIGSQASYRAVEHMDTRQFCGQTCHVMTPEFTAHRETPPHQSVDCVACHVGPGAAGWVEAKASGTRQLLSLLLDNFPRPIESAMESNRLAASADTCEHCHSREKVIGARVRVLTKFAEDERNTRTETVLTMQVGGGEAGGIHGAHMGRGTTIRYAASDKKRQTIPWVEVRNAKGETTAYLAGGATQDSVRSLPVFEMQCVDCHNRAAHAFEQPERAVDGAIASGRIAADLPFVKKTGVALLKTQAADKIALGLSEFYQRQHPGAFDKRKGAIDTAGRELAAIYNRNVFPEWKVTWGTYVNNLGHTDSPGCFRCHDGDHTSGDKKTIGQDCSSCHQAVAVEEAAPEVLKTLGIQH